MIKTLLCTAPTPEAARLLVTIIQSQSWGVAVERDGHEIWTSSTNENLLPTVRNYVFAWIDGYCYRESEEKFAAAGEMPCERCAWPTANRVSERPLCYACVCKEES